MNKLPVGIALKIAKDAVSAPIATTSAYIDFDGLAESLVERTIKETIAASIDTAAIPFAILGNFKNCSANVAIVIIPIQTLIPVRVDIIRLSSLSPANLVAAINPITIPEKAAIEIKPFFNASSSKPLIIFTDTAIASNAAPIPSIEPPSPSESLLYI